jgi:hypothetical protein
VVGSTSTIRRTGVPAFELTHLPACAACSLELVGYGNQIVDRQTVTVPDEHATGSYQYLTDDELIHGRWLTGGISLTRDGTARDLRVQLRDDSGRIVADSRGPATRQACVNRVPCDRSNVFAYRLGLIKDNVTAGTLVVLLGTTRLASEKVTLAAGEVENYAPPLTVTLPRQP